MNKHVLIHILNCNQIANEKHSIMIYKKIKNIKLLNLEFYYFNMENVIKCTCIVEHYKTHYIEYKDVVFDMNIYLLYNDFDMYNDNKKIRKIILEGVKEFKKYICMKCGF